MDYIPAGTTDKSVPFKMPQTGLTLASTLSSYARWDEGDGTSFEASTAITLAALTSISTSHTDNYGLYLSSVENDPNSFIMRVDYPDAAFAAGKERVICSIYNPDLTQPVSRIFRLISDSDIASIKTDTGTTIPAGLLDISTDTEAILEDTGTTIPAGLLDISTDTEAILEDTGTTIPEGLGAITADIEDILEDTSITIPAGLLDISTDTEAILEDTGTSIPAGLLDISTDTEAILEDTGTSIPAGLLDISTDTEAILEDTGTTLPASLAAITADTEDIQSRIPVSLSGGLMRCDVYGLEGSTSKAGVFAEAIDGTTESTAAAGSTTSIMQTNLSEITPDHYKGAVVSFTSGNLKGQKAVISAYSSGGAITFTDVVTDVPQAGDKFIIT